MTEPASNPEEPATPPAKKTWRRRILREIPWLLAFAAVFWYVGKDQSPRLQVGQTSARFEIPLVGGGTLNSGQWEGIPQVLVFWAPWCSVCGAEFPLLNDIQEELGDRARVIGIGLSGSEAEMKAFVSKHGPDFPNGIGSDKVERQFGVRAFPTIFVLDGQGVVVDRLVGITTPLRIRWALRGANTPEPTP